ncbi:MAG TPA: DUF2085 domain-containing protein [Anaerolineales bacterium]|nr:DUF2085 domain-containing protein [Anaerolineales bacterium]
MLTVTLYTRQNCHLCERAREDLQSLQEIIPHQLVEIDIDQDESLQKAYGKFVPVVQVGPYVTKAPFDRQKLQATLGAARDRQTHLEKVGDDAYRSRVARGQKITGTDRFTYWFSHHYLLVLNLMVLLYVGLPILAPVLMKSGAETPGRVIHKFYGSMCHQLSYRSWFLFGEQPVYPRAAAHMEGYLTFEEATGLDEDALLPARNFLGNERVGYKMALCERDIAIYGAIFIFGVLFALSKRKWKSLPIWAWLLIGVVPIGLDGFSQLFSQWADMGVPIFKTFFGWLPYRESTPFLRTLTGFLFGFTTAWFGYPLIEEAMADTRRLMARKFAVVAQRQVNDSDT